ncbi:MAG TPA: Gfo/Idh/MocA family oxidoreductase [Anaerolineae bacterium]|nr:Gfo/Idh/MocA family oxidoreductase [Anaerolineae bacterium]
MPPISLLIIGAGNRGAGYATAAQLQPERVRIAGVAEPRAYHRQALAQTYNLPKQHVFADWREAASRPRFADAVVIATPDALHVEPAIAFARLGYAMLLEKPMAPNEADCRRIVDAVEQSGIIFAVGHVLRYTPYTRQIKALLAAGAIGDLVSIQHLEPVGYWHFAHSFVRGNWRNEGLSSPVLLAKSCHDLDWIRYIMGAPCRALSSFGSLRHFRAEERPAGAAERCLDCQIEPDCPYSARKIYLGRVAQGQVGWPVDVLTPDVTAAGVEATLRAGPYGRCVYACDNDVLDNQVVAMQFEGGRTASFSLAAFTEAGPRRTTICGTRGELHCDGRTIRVHDFLRDATQEYDVARLTADQPGGHGGGDYGLMDAFISAVAANDRGLILSGPRESLETHLMVFAAERARREGRVALL